MDRLETIKQLQAVIYDQEREVIRLNDEIEHLEVLAKREEKIRDKADEEQEKEIERLRKVGNEMLSDIQSNTICATDFKRIAQLEKWKQALKEGTK